MEVSGGREVQSALRGRSVHTPPYAPPSSTLHHTPPPHIHHPPSITLPPPPFHPPTAQVLSRTSELALNTHKLCAELSHFNTHLPHPAHTPPPITLYPPSASHRSTNRCSLLLESSHSRPTSSASSSPTSSRRRSASACSWAATRWTTSSHCSQPTQTSSWRPPAGCRYLVCRVFWLCCCWWWPRNRVVVQYWGWVNSRFSPPTQR